MTRTLQTQQTKLTSLYHQREQQLHHPQTRPHGNTYYPPILFIKHKPTTPPYGHNPLLTGLLQTLNLTPKDCYYTHLPQHPYQGPTTPQKTLKQTKQNLKLLLPEIQLIDPQIIILLGPEPSRTFNPNTPYENKLGTIEIKHNYTITTTYDLDTIKGNPQLICATNKHYTQLKPLILKE